MKKSDRSYNSTDLRKVVLNKEEWVAQVDSIRAMVKTGATLKYLGKHYGVSRQRMHQVMKQLGLAPFKPTPAEREQKSRMYWIRQVDYIKSLVGQGKSLKEIAAEFSISKSRVSQVMADLGISMKPIQDDLKKKGSLHKRVLDRMGNL